MIVFENFYKNLKDTHSYILYFLPFALVTGPFFSDLTIILSSLLFIFFSLKEKKYYFYFNKYFIIFLLWCLYLIFSSLLSSNIMLSLESSLFYFRFGFFSLSIWYILEINSKFLNNFLKSIAIVFLFLIVDSLIQLYFGKNIIGFGYDKSRLSSFFGEEKILGSFLSRLSPFFILFLIINKQFNKYYLIIFSFCLLLFIVFLTGERSALLYLIMTMFIIIFSFKNKLLYKLLFIISLIIISITLSLSFENIYKRIVLQTYNDFTKNDNFYIFSEFHQKCYEISLNEFTNKPIFGIGPKISRQIYIDLRNNDILSNGIAKKPYELDPTCISHPHNYYVQLLSETGIIGTIPIIILFLIVTYKIFKNILLNNFYNKNYLDEKILIFYISIFISIFPLVPAGNFFNNWISILHFLPFGFIAYYNNNHTLNND